MKSHVNNLSWVFQTPHSATTHRQTELKQWLPRVTSEWSTYFTRFNLKRCLLTQRFSTARYVLTNRLSSRLHSCRKSQLPTAVPRREAIATQGDTVQILQAFWFLGCTGRAPSRLWKEKWCCVDCQLLRCDAVSTAQAVARDGRASPGSWASAAGMVLAAGPGLPGATGNCSGFLWATKWQNGKMTVVK